MAWLQLSLTLHAAEQARVEAALADLGALAMTLQDADSETANEQAILEPGVGETPLWDEIVLHALFDAAVDRAGLVHALADFLPELVPERLAFSEVADQDWTRAWMDTFQPMRFGRRLWIYPWNIEAPHDDPHAVVVRLDPGLAFGTGTHPTTALCLEWLDAIDVTGKRLIDYGCGSGVLAIAALKLGAGVVTGVDNDAQAIDASRDNAGRNGVVDRLELCFADQPVQPQADFLVANILAGPLNELAPTFGVLVRPRGAIALSGILSGQENELLTRYAEWFDDLAFAEKDGWVRITGARKSAA